MAGTPLKRARREQREADQLATFPTTKRPPLPEPRTEPVEYSPDLHPELLQLSAHGYSLTEIAAHWCISEETLNAWGKAHSSLAETFNHARAREKAWWISRARIAIDTDNNRFPAGAWSHVMRARFPDEYGEKGPTIHLDLGQLVVIQRARPEQLTGSQSGSDAKPLIEGRTVRLHGSQTVDQEADSNLLSGAAGEPQSPGATGRGEGG